MASHRRLSAEPHNHSSPPLSLFHVSQIISACKLDIFLLLGILFMQYRDQVVSLIAQYLGQLWPVVVATFAIVGCNQVIKAFGHLNACETTPKWTGLGQPLIFPSRTSHSRLFPKKHSFSYSYLLVGVPVGWEGAAGGMVSTGRTAAAPSIWSWLFLGRHDFKSWFHVDPQDHLETGGGQQSLREKLDAYLKLQGADPATYPHAYLVTAPKFIGYNFNPVSFWYLYGPDKELAAMILEVNNTFDERRPYLLTIDRKPQLNEKDDGEGDGDMSKHMSKTNDRARKAFTNAWEKDFHVSPFNSRKGSYTLTAYDPWDASTETPRGIELTIVLRSSKSHGKLVARVFPEADAVVPNTLSIWQKLNFLFAWCWVGFATFPRILKEAALLFQKRKLHVWIRPEPLKESMGRNADSTETTLEPSFRLYLRHLVHECGKAVALTYVPSRIPGASKELMLSPSARTGSSDIVEVDFKVLTPVFYSRFTYYAHDLEALFCESQESCTIQISRPDLLPQLVLRKPSPTIKLSSGLDFALLKAIQYLRRRPERIQTPAILFKSTRPAEGEQHSTIDIRGFRISAMDGFIMSSPDPQTRRRYATAVLKLFLADRVALGMMPLLEAQILILRIILAVGVAKLLHAIFLR